MKTRFIALSGGPLSSFTPAVPFFVNCASAEELDEKWRRQKISPFLMFVGTQQGKAEEAMNQYISLFPYSCLARIERYGKGEQDPEGTVKYAEFSLYGQEFIAMDSALEHSFGFTEALSFLVECESQEEIDVFWRKLTEGGEEGPCGWLKDRYGLSWQISAAGLSEMLDDPDPIRSERFWKAFLKMKKIDINALRRAYEGKGE